MAPARDVDGPASADALLGELSGVVAALSSAVETETALIGAGRLREGLDAEVRKAELGQDYIRILQAAKRNVVALTRHAPERLRAFRVEQVALERVLARNQTVIATARSISESLIKGLAEGLELERRPGHYGSKSGRPSGVPLVFSRQY